MRTTTKNLFSAILLSGIVLMIVSFNITLLYNFNTISKKNKQMSEITAITTSLISQDIIIINNKNLLIDSLKNELIIKDSLLSVVP